MQDRLGTSIKGEWECDECGYVQPRVSSKPPAGRCPECSETEFVFFEYSDEDSDEDSDWDDDNL